MRRRELGVKGFARGAARGGDQLGCRLGRLVYVRAGEVELDRGDARLPVKTLTDDAEVFLREPSDRDPELELQGNEQRQDIGDEAIDSRPLQAN